MTHYSSPHQQARGAALVESMIALGVLAIAVPLVFGALAEAGRSEEQAGTDSRSTAIVAECMASVARIRAGQPGWFEPAAAGIAFPPSGEVWALAFAEDGHVIGRMNKAAYDRGVREWDGQAVRYLATLRATPQNAVNGGAEAGMAQGATAQPMKLSITLEHPAAAAASRRKVQIFHSLLR